MSYTCSFFCLATLDGQWPKRTVGMSRPKTAHPGNSAEAEANGGTRAGDKERLSAMLMPATVLWPWHRDAQ